LGIGGILIPSILFGGNGGGGGGFVGNNGALFIGTFLIGLRFRLSEAEGIKKR
jgi:hypothetical protein